MATFNQPLMYNKKQMGSFNMLLSFPSLQSIGIGESNPPSQSALASNKTPSTDKNAETHIVQLVSLSYDDAFYLTDGTSA